MAIMSGTTSQSLDSHSITAFGLMVRVTTYGASLMDLRLCDAPDFASHSLVLGFTNPASYASHNAHMGATAGRYANRIANGQFQINGQDYHCDRNENGTHCLHGGSQGCGTMIWQITDHGPDFVTMCYEEPDGWMGFPGRVRYECTYQLKPDATLAIMYKAQVSQPTIINLAHHSYFNLSGGSDIADHLLQVAADDYLPVRPDMIPTGEIVPVANSLFDFREKRAIGHHAYDHNFCLRPHQGLRQVACLSHPQTGIEMRLSSDQAGLQFYTGDHLHERVDTHHKVPYGPRSGLCLEPQNWPNSPNEDHFPSALVTPSMRYHQQLEMTFSLSSEIKQGFAK
ncbi:MAG: aldose epimerase family protein [Candidatus Puniceispirillaceae bacterium]